MPPSYRLPTAQSLGRQSDGEKKVRGLQRREDRHGRGGAVEVVCSTRIKQTELVPCEKSHRSRNLTGTIDFFFFLPPHPPTRVFSASRCLFSKRSNLRGHLRRWAAYTFYPCFFSFFSLPLSRLHIFFFLSFTISNNFCPTILLFFSQNFHPADPVASPCVTGET